MSDQATIRIVREVEHIRQSGNPAIAAAYQEHDVHHARTLIVGAPDTPYEFGFFEFSIKFPTGYPSGPPTVLCLTTNNGKTRMSPNIYSCGRVCLTWRGEPGEQWSSAQGLESILLSIQSLLSAHPYANEPGYDGGKSNPTHEVYAKEYIDKIRHETLRISVINRLEFILGISEDNLSKRKWSSLPIPPVSTENHDQPTPHKKAPRSEKKELVPPEPGASATNPHASPLSSSTIGETSISLSNMNHANHLPTHHQTAAQSFNIVGQNLPECNADVQSAESGPLSIAFAKNLASLRKSQTDLSNANSMDCRVEWDPFTDLLKRRFLWYYDAYHNAIQLGVQKFPQKRSFAAMPFEAPGNDMTGKFDYQSLLSKLEVIKDAILEETNNWSKAIDDVAVREGRMFYSLRRQYEQIIQHFRVEKDYTIDISLSTQPGPEGKKETIENPFIWNITYFGKPMTHLDGAVINMKCYLSPRFPSEQPRVFVEEPKLFHIYIAPASNLLCYEVPKKKEEDMMQHIQCIIAALEGSEQEKYDPWKMVNKEAWDIAWGKPEPLQEVMENGGEKQTAEIATVTQSNGGEYLKETNGSVGNEKSKENKEERGSKVSGWRLYHRMLRRSIENAMDV